MSRLNTYLENHAALGWLGSALSFFTGLGQWFINHADDFTKLAGLASVLVGFVAGYYTLRIQRRAWKRAQHEDRINLKADA